MAKSLTLGIIPTVAMLITSLAMLARGPSQDPAATDQAVVTRQEAIDIAFTHLFTANTSAAAFVDQEIPTHRLTEICITGDGNLREELRSNGRWVATFPELCVFMV